jgi:glycosyltransferase involved in cell wall biosynthesis
MTPITAIIITHNEEERIAETISSLSCCEEILVIDAESTDRTCEIATKCGARVFVRAWEGFARQKNFGAEQASHDWILSIDADERPSIELANEIMGWKRRPEESAARSMPRRVSYFGAWISHSGWYPDRKIRLFNRRFAKWQGDGVHESMMVDGPIEQFQGDLLHIPYRSWADHLQRIDRYTAIASKAAHDSGKRGNPLMLLVGPPISFLRTFVLRLGFLDGWRGALIAYAGARYVFLRELRILR